MSLVRALGLWGLGLSLSCGSGDEQACTPGESVACTGPETCDGFQVCNAEGTGFGTCECGGNSTTSTSGGTTTGSGGSGSTSSTGAAGGDSGGGGAGGGGAWSPADLPGLALWFHAEAGLVYDPQFPAIIIKWDDQSPNAHQAVIGGNQPGQGLTLDPSALNGFDAVRCINQNGAEMRIADHPSLQWGTQGHMIAAVVRTDPAIGFYPARFLAKGLGLGVELTQSAQDGLGYTLGNDAVTVSIPDDAPHWHVVVARGPTLQLQVGSSSATGSTSTADVSLPGELMRLCHNAPTSLEIAEIFAVKGAVSDGDMASARAYLESKYGL